MLANYNVRQGRVNVLCLLITMLDKEESMCLLITMLDKEESMCCAC